MVLDTPIALYNVWVSKQVHQISPTLEKHVTLTVLTACLHVQNAVSKMQHHKGPLNITPSLKTFIRIVTHHDEKYGTFFFLLFLGASIVGVNCHFDPDTCLKTLKLMKEGLVAAKLKAHLMSQPLAFHTPDCGKQGFIDLPEFPFGKILYKFFSANVYLK